MGFYGNCTRTAPWWYIPLAFAIIITGVLISDFLEQYAPLIPPEPPDNYDLACKNGLQVVQKCKYFTFSPVHEEDWCKCGYWMIKTNTSKNFTVLDCPCGSYNTYPYNREIRGK
jgi:hypothetical protein